MLQRVWLPQQRVQPLMEVPMNSSQPPSLRQCIALKLMPDIRFYDSGAGPAPVLELPPALASALRTLSPGGLILFRENLASVAQIRRLTAQLRDCLGPRALIGVDQEGGRVTRLPRAQCTSFSGNMALAACPDAEQLARQVGAAQAAELRALGINLNFVPALDVNSNPHNPVIGARSFGDDPERVAVLGAALLEGLQGGGVAGSLKHFPGHGDTSQDSHTDLPSVSRGAEQALAIDLAPFARVIGQSAPAMVMTAHIQYPALDASTIPGTDVVLPATLSRAILTGLLREQLGYRGVIITDALDMRAISARLTPAAAVVACFRAGVDIALMPLLLRSTASFEAYEAIIAAVTAAVASGELDEDELRASAARVQALQAQFPGAADDGAAAQIGCEQHLALERRIAASSLTLVAGKLPALAADAAVHLLMPDGASADALRRALLAQQSSLRVSCQGLDNFDVSRERQCLQQADLYLVGVSEPANSAVVAGGAEDLARLPDRKPATVQRAMLAAAAGVPRVAIMLNSPYAVSRFEGVAEAILASYDGAPEGVGGRPGPAYQALAALLCGLAAARGTLPVRLPAAAGP
ncbi:glycoside hydrolase family 3 protein [Seongchinamella sediminis]|nr:glycoside hydrolase family 3 protein [Seongchinamella sediminis]